jgi:Family of unknown function (DUF6931)
MQIQSLTKVTAPRASEVCALAAAGGIALEAPEGQTPAQFLAALVAADSLTEAVQFLAFALPARESVWWACTCVRAQQAAGAELAPPMLAALEAAEAWVKEPSDENRRSAMERAQATAMDAAAAWAAIAAFWSGGSMAPKDLPEVPPPPHLLGVAVSGAVTLAAVQPDPQQADEKRQRFVAAGVDIANGGSGQTQLGTA